MPKKKSVQKRVSDASKKKIAKAEEKRRKARAAGTKAAKSKKRATQAKGVYKYYSDIANRESREEEFQERIHRTGDVLRPLVKKPDHADSATRAASRGESRARHAAAKKNLKKATADEAKARRREVSAIRETRAAKSDKVGKAARTGESMKAHAKKKKKPAKLRPGTSNPW
jgi:hypothetical protein